MFLVRIFYIEYYEKKTLDKYKWESYGNELALPGGSNGLAEKWIRSRSASRETKYLQYEAERARYKYLGINGIWALPEVNVETIG